MNFANIKLIILDCDGVLSDGQIIYDGNSIETKSFSARDGLGVKLLDFTDIQVAVVTGRRSEILAKRCADLGITILHQKIRNKFTEVKGILKELNLTWDNVAYMGDDWNDYPVLQHVAISSCPNNVAEDFKAKCDFVAEHDGGKGAVRDLITYILKNKGTYDKVIEDYLVYLQQ